MVQVNVLTHVQEVTFTSDQQAKVEMIKQKHIAQDEREIFGREQIAVDKVERQEEVLGEITGAFNLQFHNSDTKVDPRSNSKDSDVTGINVLNETAINRMLVNQQDVSEGGEVDENLVSSGVVFSDNNVMGIEHPEGGALWDIFRRQDSPKLEEYLRKYFKEFRHTYCRPLDQVKTVPRFSLFHVPTMISSSLYLDGSL